MAKGLRGWEVTPATAGGSPVTSLPGMIAACARPENCSITLLRVNRTSHQTAMPSKAAKNESNRIRKWELRLWAEFGAEGNRTNKKPSAMEMMVTAVNPARIRAEILDH